MMTDRKPPPDQAQPPARRAAHDPYRLRTLEQILTLFDGGDFLADLMDGHARLMQQLVEHREQHGDKGCTGTMTLQLSYAVGHAGDTGMAARVDWKGPKAPPSKAAAYVDEHGQLTLYSPMMARMHAAPRDIREFDPETGEIRDV